MKTNSRMTRLITLTLSLLALATTAIAEDFSYPPDLSLDAVRKHVDAVKMGHPRLLVSADGLTELRQSLSKDPLRRSLAEGVIKQADGLLNVAPIKREKQGRRLLGQSRRCVQRVLTLSMAYHLTGEPKYVKRCEKEMLAVSEFSDWNPSHFLDVAEMTFALAIGYDWLYDKLSAASRVKIRSAIIDKGVALPFNSRHKGWVRSRNNWGQVCHGGLTAGALAVLEDEPALAARTVHNALHNVTYSMAAYAPNGSYPEGPGYWSYGTSYNVLLIAVLESVMGTDFALTKAPGFSKTGQFLSLATGPSGQFFNYADGGSGRGTQPSLFWFASRYERPDWLLGEYERVNRDVERMKRSSGAGRLFPLVLLWMNNGKETSDIRMPLHWSSEGETPITVHRSSWTDPKAVFLGVKAGSPSGNHGQMDTGSFVLDADGVRWAMDLGAEGYHGIESRGMNLWSRSQDSDRWTIFRQSNEGHNTLVIDGRLQTAKGNAPVIKFSDDPKFPHTIVDLSPVYEGQAESIHRGFALLPSGEVLIQDELSGLRSGSRVRWG
ncbi:MAG: heparinase II/III domain-containing protein [Planctomycetota bacterium]